MDNKDNIYISDGSNIDIRSNIFIRSQESLAGGDLPEKDARFVSRIYDRAALKKLREHAEKNGLTAPLTEAQEEFLDIKPCKFNTDGEVTHGLVYDGGELVIECRCSKEDCPRAVKCGRLSGKFTETAEVTVTAETASAAASVSEIPETATAATVAAAVSAETEVKPEPEVKPEVKRDPFLEKFSALPRTEVGEGLKLYDGKCAVLCRNGGYAEYLSGLFTGLGIAHTVGKEVSLSRKLADVLWDYGAKTMTRDVFIKRFSARCGGEDAAVELFSELCGYAGTDEKGTALDCGALAGKLCGSEGGSLMTAVRGGTVIAELSEIKELDPEPERLYIFGFAEETLTEEERGYIEQAISGKNPEILCCQGEMTFVGNTGGRFAKTEQQQDGQTRCVGVSAGKAEDINRYSFISGAPAEAVTRQAYISKNVKNGDGITLRLSGGVYEIVHNGFAIGKTSESFSAELLGEFGGKKYLGSLPETISGLFVRNVVSVVADSIPENITGISEQFRNRHFWLGAEIGGFGSFGS